MTATLVLAPEDVVPGSPTRETFLLGLPLVRRAALAAARAGFDRVYVLGGEPGALASELAGTQREIETRYDLKGSKNEIKQEKMVITITSGDDMKLKAVLDILHPAAADDPFLGVGVRLPERRLVDPVGLLQNALA